MFNSSSVEVIILPPIQMVSNGKIKRALALSYWIIFYTYFSKDTVPDWSLFHLSCVRWTQADGTPVQTNKQTNWGILYKIMLCGELKLSNTLVIHCPDIEKKLLQACMWWYLQQDWTRCVGTGNRSIVLGSYHDPAHLSVLCNCFRICIIFFYLLSLDAIEDHLIDLLLHNKTSSYWVFKIWLWLVQSLLPLQE